MEEPIERNEIVFLLADNHSIVRQGMAILIDEVVPNSKIYQTSSSQQIVEMIKANGVEIAVIDAHFPDGNSLHIIPLMKMAKPDIKILVFTGLEEELHVLKFIKAGASGYVSKLSEETEIRQAISDIVHKGEYFSPLQGI
ncbi:response regulator [Chryseobacterium oranimense]|uniref:response regulator n=1 Tax=Chryseobacterium oranimense TaxID=421058 RepID=UPI000A8BA83D|nr:response regulator transcription factor [Chryseobacterium oranimense]